MLLLRIAHAVRHDARVTELLEANNREVERRRAAQGEVNILVRMLSAVTRNALWDIVTGKAAVVPLAHPAYPGAKLSMLSYVQDGYDVRVIGLDDVRLDKLAEGGCG